MPTGVLPVSMAPAERAECCLHNFRGRPFPSARLFVSLEKIANSHGSAISQVCRWFPLSSFRPVRRAVLAISREQFVDCLGKSGLLSTAELAALTGDKS